MARKSSAVIRNDLELRRAALAANSAELPHLEVSRQQLETMLAEMRDLSAQQASLTAAKQEVTKRLGELNTNGLRLMTFLDAGVRQRYGTRAEKLVEFGQQPFRSRPRIRLVGPNGKPVKTDTIPAEPASHSALPE